MGSLSLRFHHNFSPLLALEVGPFKELCQIVSNSESGNEHFPTIPAKAALGQITMLAVGTPSGSFPQEFRRISACKPSGTESLFP